MRNICGVLHAISNHVNFQRLFIFWNGTDFALSSFRILSQRKNAKELPNVKINSSATQGRASRMHLIVEFLFRAKPGHIN